MRTICLQAGPYVQRITPRTHTHTHTHIADRVHGFPVSLSLLIHALVMCHRPGF